MHSQANLNGGPMASKSENVEIDEFEQAARAIFEVVDDLGEGALTLMRRSLLNMHATQLSFATA